MAFFHGGAIEGRKGKIIGAIETLQDISDRKTDRGEANSDAEAVFVILVRKIQLLGISIIQNDQSFIKTPYTEKLLGPFTPKDKIGRN